MNGKWIKIKNIVPQVLAVAFIMLVIFYPTEKSQPAPASILQSAIQSETNANQVATYKSIEKIPDDIYAYYPIAVGNKWEYTGWEKTCYDCAVPDSTIVKNYISTSTIKSIKQNKNNSEIEIETCTETQNIEPPGVDEWGITIKDGCGLGKIYLVDNKICDDANCDSVKFIFPFPEEQTLPDAYYDQERKTLVDDKRYVYYAGKKQTATVLGKNNNDCFPIKYDVLSSESSEMFCYGIGTISYSYDHNGSLDIIEEKLTSINFDVPK